MCRLFGHSVQQNIENAYQLIRRSADARKTVEPILNQMPNTFTLKQFKEARLKNRQSANVKCILHLYVKKGLLERLEKGKYKKVAPLQLPRGGENFR